MHRVSVVAAGAAAIVILTPAPASAATSCGTAKGVRGASVTKVTTSSGGCTSAKTVAKAHARTRVVSGWTCKERMLSSRSGGFRAAVTCRRAGRKVTFIVHWRSSMPLPPPAAAPPSVNGA